MIQPSTVKSITFTQGSYTVTLEKSQTFNSVEIENDGLSIRFATSDFSLEAVIEALQTVKDLIDNQ